MATKTAYILGLVSGVESQAANRAPGNDLIKALQPLKERMEAKVVLGKDPTESKAPAVLAGIKAAVAAHNAAVVITLPSDAEIIQGLTDADSATPTEL